MQRTPLDLDTYNAFWKNRRIMCYVTPLHHNWTYYVVSNNDGYMTAYELFFVSDHYYFDYIHYPTPYLDMFHGKCFDIRDLVDRLREFIEHDILDKENTTQLSFHRETKNYADNNHNPVFMYVDDDETHEYFRKRLDIHFVNNHI